MVINKRYPRQEMEATRFRAGETIRMVDICRKEAEQTWGSDQTNLGPRKVGIIKGRWSELMRTEGGKMGWRDMTMK